MKTQPILKRLQDSLNVSKGRARFTTIRERILAAAKIDAIHVCQLIAAMLIASIGLNTDSTEAVIGAMLICPLMGSVFALAYALAIMDMRLLRQSLGDMLLQCGVCLITSTIYFFLSPLSVETTKLIANSQPTIWDLLLALVGGFAGALGLSRRQEPSTLIAGVAVATALMPPLCAVGYGVAMFDLTLAASALYEFAINVVFIATGAAAVFALLHVPFKGDLDGDGVASPNEVIEARRDSRYLRHYLVVALLLFAGPCIYFSAQMVHNASEDNQEMAVALDPYDTQTVTRELDVVCPGLVTYTVGEEDWFDELEGSLKERLVATVVTQKELTAEQQRQSEELIRIHVEDLDLVRFEVGSQQRGTVQEDEGGGK